MASRTDSRATRLRDHVTAVRRAVLRRRRLLAVLCTVAAVAAGLRAVQPPDPATAEVVVAERDLPAGAVLSAADLRRVALPPDAVPAHLLDDPVGTTLAAPVGRGEPITSGRVMGAALVADTPGVTAVPVRFSDPDQAALLRVGMRIDVLATDPKAGATETVAADVAVLGLPDPAAGPADATLTGRLVVLGIPDGRVHTVTAATVATYVTFAWSRL